MLGGLIMLAAVSCLGLGLWRLTSDLGWTGAFAIPDGLLSHWQVWLALAVGFGGAALRLMRYGRPPEERVPRANKAPAAQPVKSKVKDRAATR
jgi:TRAP-type C4-dicarboxylate transport system permease small subunit